LIIKGKAIIYGDDVNTDEIIPGRFLNITDPKELASHSMQGIDSNFFKKFRKGDIIVTGKNFGCGSSREQAAMCLKYAGVGAIVAKSFARIFYRNAINLGLPIFESLTIGEDMQNMDEIEINSTTFIIKNVTKNLELELQPLPAFIQEIINDGGLISHLQKKMKS